MSIERMNMPAFHPEVPTAYEYIDGQCNTYPQTPLVPQTFGEELSYYETLVLMNKKINEIIDSINSGATLNVETTTTSTTADYATNSGTATSTNYANKASVAKCAEMAKVADYANEAGNAKKADRATIADNVTHSSTSDYATTAGSSSTATTANYATSAGYATNCATADTAQEADEADYAKNAGKLQGHPASDFMLAGQSLTNPMTTSGDMIVGGLNGTPQRLGKGNNGTYLKIVDGQPTWASTVASNEVIQTNTQPSASEYKVWIKPSTSEVKYSNGGVDASWFSTPTMTNPMSASGDIIVGGTNGTPQRLAKGIDEQILALNNGTPTWENNPIRIRTSTGVNPSASAYKMLAGSNELLQYSNGTTWNIQNAGLKEYLIDVDTSSGWETTESNTLPTYYCQVVTTIPLSKYPNADDLYPIIQVDHSTGNEECTWTASKKKCYVGKVYKDTTLSNQYFIAEVYCDVAFTGSEYVIFDLFDTGNYHTA